MAQSCKTQQGAPPCRAGIGGFWPPKAQGARSVVLRFRSPTRKLTTPRPLNKDPALGPQGMGPAGFGQICSTGTRSKDQGSPGAAPGREAEARSAQKGTRRRCTSDPSSQSPWPRGRVGQAKRAAIQRPAQSSSTGDTRWMGPAFPGAAGAERTWHPSALKSLQRLNSVPQLHPLLPPPALLGPEWPATRPCP